NWCWITLTAYYVGDVVSWDTGKVYACITAGTSGATGPTGTDDDITDGTAHWKYCGTPRPAGLTAFEYAYIVPADCLRISKVLCEDQASEDDPGQPYKLEGIAIYCDDEVTVLKYVYQETDPTVWDRLLRTAVAHRLAAEIAYQVTGEENKKKDMEGRYSAWMQMAKQQAMLEGSSPPTRPDLWTDLK
ncbi:MAG: hypothetical protein ABFC80_08740, partial [Coriobacteriales bacterium]